MSWSWFAIFYLIVSLILCEGLLYYNKKRGLRTETSHYFVLLLLGPFTLVLMLLLNLLKKKPN